MAGPEEQILKQISYIVRHFHIRRLGKFGRHGNIDMLNGPVLGPMLMFALPLMLSSVMQLLFNAADVIVVGRFAGDNSLAAVGSTSSLINLMLNLFLGISVGVNVLVAHYIGARDEKSIHGTVHTAMLISIISGLGISLIGIAGARIILGWMRAPEDVIGLATLYLRIYFIGVTFTMVYNFGAAILRATGDTERPLIYLLIAGVINVILNLFFVIVLKLDVAGVAIATIVSQGISASLMLRCLIHEKSAVHLDLKKLHIDPGKLSRILQIGLPAGLQSVLFSLSNVIIQSSINSFGATVVAGSAASANIEGFVYVAMNSFYQATMTFTGQNMGAGKHERINRILLTGLACVAVTGLVLGNAVYLNGSFFLHLYTPSAQVVQAGLRRMAKIATMYFICGMMDTMVGSLRGMGYAVMPMIVSLMGACVLRIVFIFTLFQTSAFHTENALYMTYPVSWTVTLLAHVICFITVRRKLKRVWGC